MALTQPNDTTPLLDSTISKTTPLPTTTPASLPSTSSLPPLPLPAPVPSPASLGLSKDHPFLLRRALPSDTYAVARLATTSYAYSEFSGAISPHRFNYWHDWIREYHSRNHISLLQPHKLGFVLYPAGYPQHIVGFSLFTREGNDPAAVALREMSPAHTPWGKVKRWWWTAYWGVYNKLFPSRATDYKALGVVLQSVVNRERVWEEAGMGERWHCGSCIVLPEYQKRGLGEKMIRMVTGMADAEGVGLVLEASPDGERLYRKVGFVRVGLFGQQWRSGGIMLWLPSWRKGEAREWECTEDGGEGKRYVYQNTPEGF